MSDDGVERIDLLAALQASIDRHKLRTAADRQEPLAIMALDCGCRPGKGHVCDPPF